MACGICDPEAMRLTHSCVDQQRVFGYTTMRPLLGLAIRALYFHGAEMCYFDNPEVGVNVLRRPQMKLLSKCLRSGDVLLVARRVDISSTTQDVLSDEGVEVKFLANGAVLHPGKSAGQNRI